MHWPHGNVCRGHRNSTDDIFDILSRRFAHRAMMPKDPHLGGPDAF